ncbi:LOW QUALITY PROTEIN: hypothetical protein MC885_020459 [Smutsia gigantea]|nr:LOW QUALITY PROTEIN: hypothetical protein MC885_020459 [Smutsia gigantea]
MSIQSSGDLWASTLGPPRAISPTFDLQSLSCSLEVSKDCQTSGEICDLPGLMFPDLLFWAAVLGSGHSELQPLGSWGGFLGDELRPNPGKNRIPEWKGTSQLSVWHTVKETVLGSEKPRVVGIWLDLKEGKLAFYSVANEQKLLFECPVSASSPLLPAFWLYGLQPGNSLTVRPVKM